MQNAQRGDTRALPARVHPPGALGAGSAGHPDSALQEALVSLRASSRACSTASGAPRPGLLAVPGRAAASPSPRDADGRPAHLRPIAFPSDGGCTARPAFPGSAYLALDLLHHFGCWSLTSDRKQRWKRIQRVGRSLERAQPSFSLYNRGGAGGRARRACGGGAPALASCARQDSAARPRLPQPRSRRMGTGPRSGAGLSPARGGAPGDPPTQTPGATFPHPSWEWVVVGAIERVKGRVHSAPPGEAGRRRRRPHSEPQGHLDRGQPGLKGKDREGAA
ncbi:uncharacterized protein [Equus przewalskii]|uniref:Uncharacterized protein n=1 Tax=Equus przewalskii TaxID=9798 RepID=A0ABM4MEG7_EQUPR